MVDTVITRPVATPIASRTICPLTAPPTISTMVRARQMFWGQGKRPAFGFELDKHITLFRSSMVC